MYQPDMIMNGIFVILAVIVVYAIVIGLGFQSKFFSRFYNWGFSDKERAPIGFVATFGLVIFMSTLISFVMCNHMFSKYQMQNVELYEKVSKLMARVNDSK